MLVPNSPADEMVQSVLASMSDLSAQLPPAKPGDAAMVPIATLDLNIGVSLPAEELVGSLPQVIPASNRQLARIRFPVMCLKPGQIVLGRNVPEAIDISPELCDGWRGAGAVFCR